VNLMRAEFTELGDVVKIDRATASHEECRSLPYVGLEHIEKDIGAFVPQYRRVSETLLATKFRFTPRHVLYGKLRPNLNKVIHPKFDGVCTTEILPLLPVDDVLDAGYLYFLLQSPHFVMWATHRVSGANLPRLDPKTLEEYPLRLPPLSEQKALAAGLRRAQHLRRMRRCALQMCDELLPAAFFEIFGDPVLNTKGWGVRLVSEIGEVQGGLQQIAWREKLPLKKPFLRVANVQRGVLNLSDIRKIGLTESEFLRTALQKGDLLLAEGNGNPSEVGRAGMWDGSIDDCVHQNHLIRIRCESTHVLPIFLLSQLNSSRGMAYYLKHGRTTSGLVTISTGLVNEFPALVPPLEVQREFEEVAMRHTRLQCANAEALRQANHLFQTLLHQAFSNQ
jgi:type I restriction enzyme S subunit